jgi:hypothetical protein
MNKELSEIGDEILEDLMAKLPVPESAKESMRNFQKLRRELGKESDRGMALYATAYLDNQLEILLRNKLVGNNKHFKDIFSFNGPVGTFSAKIKLAYSIGLLDKISMDDINILRKIRNEFAHSDKKIDLETKDIKILIDNLKMNVKADNSTARSIFINVVAGISGRIEGSINFSEKFEELLGQSLEKRKSDFNVIMADVMKKLK